MKTITIQQPWANLICEGVKDIENRTWQTHYRGKVLIHAAAKAWSIKQLCFYFTQEMTNALRAIGFNIETVYNMPKGKIIGSVDIIDCVVGHSSIWAELTSYNWVLANPVLFPEPIPAKGKLSFWEFPMIEEEVLTNDIKILNHV